MLSRQIELLAAAGRVKRFHNTPTILTQTVGEHTWLVMGLVLMLCEDMDRTRIADILYAAFMHDVPEAATGDIPAPAKRAMGNEGRMDLACYESRVLKWAGMTEPDLSEEEARTVKIADILEGVIRCRIEVALGNSHAHDIGFKFSQYLESMAPFSERETQVLEAVAAYQGQYFDTKEI